jgi:hypothetical protein
LGREACEDWEPSLGSRKMLRLYRIQRHSMLNAGQVHRPTPFDPDFSGDSSFFNEHGIEFTDDPSRCDLFVVSHGFPPWWNSWKRKAQLFLRYQFRRHLLIWSDEPWNTDPPTFKWSNFQPVAHVMNVYTRDVLLSNFTTCDWAIIRGLPFKRLEDCPEQGKARIVGVVGYVANPNPRIVYGVNRDLNWLRIEFLKHGWERGRVDIYGPNWPDNMSKEDSREGNWWVRKHDILRNYDICLALENTNFDYYCTEKLWQSVSGGCLPIYYGKGNRIYDTLPRRSFIDAADFDSVGDIYDYIESMSRREYFERYNLCVEASNAAAATFDPDAERNAVLAKIVERVRKITA